MLPRCAGLIVLAQAVSAYGQIIGTFAGSDYRPIADRMRPLEVPLGYRSRGLSLDAAGNVCVADAGNHLVFVLGAQVGIRAGTGVRGAGPGQLNGPAGIAGCTYISDAGNRRILEVTARGLEAIVTDHVSEFMVLDRLGNLYFTSGNRVWKGNRAGGVAPFAGNGTPGFAGDGGRALDAQFDRPSGLALDRDLNLFVADSGNQRIRKVAADGTVTTFASGLRSPAGITFDGRGNLYVAEPAASSIRVIAPAGTIQSFAGDPAKAFTYSGDGGRALEAGIGVPYAVQFDSFGNLLFVDSAHDRIRRIDGLGRINLVLGNGLYRYTSDGSVASSSVLTTPSGLAFDRAGNLFVPESEGHRIRRLNANGTVTTVAGIGGNRVAPPAGNAVDAQIGAPRGGAVDAAGNYYFSTDNDRVYRLTAEGQLSVFAGTPGQTGFAGDGGRADRALLHAPEGIATDSEGAVYIADSGNDRIRKVDRSGTISTLPTAPDDSLVSPFDLAFDRDGRLHVSDATHRVRRVGPGGALTIVAGLGVRPGFEGDGRLARTARLHTPRGIAFDQSGNLYIADTGNHRVRRVDTDGVITTLAGDGTPGFAGDGGDAVRAQLFQPVDVAVDAAGRVYIADQFNDRVRVVLAQPPTFEPSETRLAFSGNSTAGETAPKSINVTGTFPGLPFTVTASTTRGGNWLRILPPLGSMPQPFQVIADPSLLPPDFYTGSITVTSPLARPATRTIAVEFSVGEPLPSRLESATNAVRFNARQRQRSSSQPVLVLNRGGGSVKLRVTSFTENGGAWLAAKAPADAVTPSQPRQVTVTATPGTLPVGTYRGQVIVSNDRGDEQTIVIVIMNVARVDQSILLSQNGLSFVAVQDGSAGPPDQFGVLNTGIGSMDWSVITSTFGAPREWLRVNRNSGSSESDSLQIPLVNVSASAAGLPPGRYYGTVRIASLTAKNSPQDVTVVLTILPRGSNPGPIVRPSGVILTGEEGTVPTTSQDLSVSNLTGSRRRFASARLTVDGVNWFRTQPEESSIDAFADARVVVRPEFARLTPGIRRGALTFLFDDGTPRAVNVLSLVLKSGAAAALKDGRAADAACTPSRLIPVFRRPGQDFSTRGGNPVTVEAQVLDDCGGALREGSVTVSFSDRSPSINLTGLGDGRWIGTWSPRGERQSAISLMLSAANEAGTASGQDELRGTVLDRDAQPEIADNGIVSSVSFLSGAPAPGSLIALFGSNLADSLTTAPAGAPLRTQLGGVTVTIAGREMPLQLASDKQINAVVPYALETNTRHQIVVRRGDALSVPEEVSLVDAQPAIFTRDQSGKGQGAIMDSAGRLVDAANPARAGDALTILCAGLGEVSPPVVAGTEAPADSPVTANNRVSVMIGGRPATVTFAGLAPGLIGFYQVVVTMPEGVAAGEAVAVAMTAAGQSSNTVTMAVQ